MRLCFVFFLVSVAAVAGLAAPASASPETQMAAMMERLKSDPPSLRAFLAEMPKGGDLHHHLDGAVWAEDYLKWAAEDGDCLDSKTHSISPPPCAKSQIEARGLFVRDPVFYQASIDALSMRNFFPGGGTGEASGHDHTFATFGRFSSVAAKHLPDALVVVRRQAAANKTLYLETMADPAAAFSPKLLGGVAQFSPTDFDSNLKQIEKLLPGLVAESRAQFDAAEAKASQELQCGSASADAACRVKTRYLFFVIRTMKPEQVFAQIAMGYALSDSDPRFVGLDLVAPEDDPVALRDYWLHMRMFRYFAAQYPKVKISLHSGELWLGLVPPSELGFHIRGTVEVAGASRIGHGYELPFERDAWSLLAEMAKKKIAVEINLTSNDITPGVKGKQHPLQMYRKAGVPVVLSADDEGVFRIDLTHEYVRAALEQGLNYSELKEISRNGLEFSFLPGASLRDGQGKIVGECAKLGAACEAFLKINEKAATQFELEKQFEAFEARMLLLDKR